MQQDEQYSDDLLNGFMDYSAPRRTPCRPPSVPAAQMHPSMRCSSLEAFRGGSLRLCPPGFAFAVTLSAGGADSGGFDAPSVSLRLGLP